MKRWLVQNRLIFLDIIGRIPSVQIVCEMKMGFITHYLFMHGVWMCTDYYASHMRIATIPLDRNLAGVLKGKVMN
jgi:hypothetical protein